MVINKKIVDKISIDLSQRFHFINRNLYYYVIDPLNRDMPIKYQHLVDKQIEAHIEAILAEYSVNFTPNDPNYIGESQYIKNEFLISHIKGLVVYNLCGFSGPHSNFN
jgi:hypothetical protein